MSKRKLNNFSLSDKLKIVSGLESGKLGKQIMSESRLTESAYRKIINICQWSEGQGSIKRRRLSEFSDVEKCLFPDITLNVSTPVSKDLVQISEDVTTFRKYTRDDNVQNCVIWCDDGMDSENKAGKSHILDRELEKVPSKQEALKALETLQKFYKNTAFDPTIINRINELEKYTHRLQTASQKKLIKYLK